MSAGPEVTIRSIAGGGDGVGTLPDGRTVFVPRTAPGDTVALADVRTHARFARGRVDHIITPGPGRAPPPCMHYTRDACGGCQLMHLDLPEQRAIKGRIVGDALRRIGRLDLPDPEVYPAPSPLGYRAKVTFTVRQGRIGYHRVGRPDEVFEVEQCLIARPSVTALHTALRNARQHLPPDAARVVLREDADGHPHLVVETPGGRAWTGGAALARALAAAGVAATVWWHPEDGAPRAMGGTDTPWPATIFEQVHPEMGRTVRAAALEALGSVGGQVAWDLYAGIGDATVELFRAGAAVTSVESDPRAVAIATTRGPMGPQRLVGRVEDRLRELPDPDVIYTNPPRTGMDARVTEAIASSGARRIGYVSCDPATLARDLARLAATHRVIGVMAFDQFPQTAHVECVATLEHR